MQPNLTEWKTVRFQNIAFILKEKHTKIYGNVCETENFADKITKTEYTCWISRSFLRLSLNQGILNTHVFRTASPFTDIYLALCKFFSTA
jgi:hypothetical protein